MVPARAYNVYADFFYDESGRVNTFDHFLIDKYGIPLMTQHTTIYYDSKGRPERERTEGQEARLVRYGYDALNRVQDIWATTDGIAGSYGYHFKYGGAGFPEERLYYVLNANGDSTTLSRDHYVFDSKGDLESLVRNYLSNISPPFITTINYKYDDKPNPWLNLPVFIYRTSPVFNSQHNPVESDGITRYFPPTTSVDSLGHKFRNKYNDGLLEEAEYGQQYAWKYVYETF